MLVSKYNADDNETHCSVRVCTECNYPQAAGTKICDT
jgi:hypothetical protein